MTIIAKLQELDQSLLSDALKGKVQIAIADYPSAENLLPEEIEALETVYNKAALYIQKVNETKQNEENARIAAEEKAKQDEAARIEQERLDAERIEKENQIKSITLPHIALYEQHKANLPAEFKTKLNGVNLLHKKFLKSPTESNQKAVLKSSDNMCNQINAYFDKLKNQAELKKQTEEKASREKILKLKTERERTDAASKQKAEADRVAAEQKAAQEAAAQEAEKRGLFQDESLKNIFGI